LRKLAEEAVNGQQRLMGENSIVKLVVRVEKLVDREVDKESVNLFKKGKNMRKNNNYSSSCS
jgi:hypothetical protein